MPKIRTYFIILLLLFPFLLSFDSSYHGEYFATYQSPEGIHFFSYSKEWDEKDLMALYQELIKNKHGKEFDLLQKVSVVGHSHATSLTKGSYHALSNSITLYQGDKYTDPAAYRETLSHEYGHHFAYHYFPSHHFPYSDWQSVRGLNGSKLRWDAFWNYDEGNHKLYPQEIFAEDYVLLYGAANMLNVKDVFTNEAFYMRTQHENQQLPNVLENQELHMFLEEGSGLKIDKDRFLQSPKLSDWSDDKLSFKISAKALVAYRLNLTFHDLNDSNDEGEELELYEITMNETTDLLHFSLDQIDPGILSEYAYVTVNIDVVDLSTSLGFETEEITLKIGAKV